MTTGLKEKSTNGQRNMFQICSSTDRPSTRTAVGPTPWARVCSSGSTSLVFTVCPMASLFARVAALLLRLCALLQLVFGLAACIVAAVLYEERTKPQHSVTRRVLLDVRDGPWCAPAAPRPQSLLNAAR
jgi:hypothetical protein